MLLLQTFMESSISKAEALTELNLEDVFRILFTSRLVFLSSGAIKSNLSENVLWLQAGFMQNIFLVFNLHRIHSISGLNDLMISCPMNHHAEITRFVVFWYNFHL